MELESISNWTGRSRRTALKGIGGLALGAVASGTAVAQEEDSRTDFTAELLPENAVPPDYEPASCDAEGVANFRLVEEEERVEYQLRLDGIEGVSGVHLHRGSSGENGPHVVDIHKGEPTGDTGEFFSLYARGEFLPDDFADDFDGSFADVVELIRDGETYLQVHRDDEGKEVVRGALK
ncbi:CHRD domain-containing protein [Halorarum halophilum]|uniref:CHRD domain-containing protein n=1 Tax=Halorarum halophilum TaxID=2743090 RepID=A0A7D5K685_9EURY|nr:CHRD domain-containing protein [Halobaculum halophilum]QLG26499.1 CHRD domain-containing protein [Halobaculum halophilum]